jgi:hypothetical protein
MLFLLVILGRTVTYSGSIGHDLTVDLPPGWIILSDTLAFPVHVVNDDASAQLSVFRSEFQGDRAIRNAGELRGSVQKVIDDVIMTLPDARLLTNTGFDRTDRAGFILEFMSRDTSAQVDLRHRFEGVLYRLENGNQVLFTLWAKVPKDQYAASDLAIRAMQASFEFNGSKDAAVFPPRFSPYLVSMLLMFLAVGLVFYAYRKRTRSAFGTSDYSESEIKTHGPSRVHR